MTTTYLKDYTKDEIGHLKFQTNLIKNLSVDNEVEIKLKLPFSEKMKPYALLENATQTKKVYCVTGKLEKIRADALVIPSNLVQYGPYISINGG